MTQTLSPLEMEIRRIISVAGPMPVAHYMDLCLAHPKYGYYLTREPFGAGGDFTTAPEVSQMFGELVGIWAASVYGMMGKPAQVHLVELGPGRGTMMRDILRATQVVPEFRKALSLHLVEISPKLEQAQREALEGFEVKRHWYRRLEDVPAGPAIIVANEFVDALPVHQAVKQAGGWHERVIGLDKAGNFKLGLAPYPIPHFDRLLPQRVREAPIGSIFEWRTDNLPLEIGRRVRDGGAALVIDYGHARTDIGDTLQAVGGHAFVDPKSAPGTVDITAHVDFEIFGSSAESMGAAIHGPVEQGEFLRRLGIEARAAALKARAPDKAGEIDAAVTRLTQGGRTGMGELFKAMALADPRLGPLPGFVV
ncbi:MAG TPA: SAM-dependent methyltransferase [Pseudorhodoplanes sp.]|jgi:SAM-dependent MidA family methyltransferase|nr:SAM-dependent methyltransferase [Pseudorhodoplanes sp.]